MIEQQLLDLTRRDVLSLADDDVLDAAGDDQVTVVAQMPEIPAPQPAVGRERRCGQSGIDVANGHERTAELDLAVLPHLRRRTAGMHDPDADAGHRSAFGKRQLLVAVSEGSHRDAWRFGHPEAVQDGRSELLAHVVEQLRGLCRAAAGELAQRRQHGRLRPAPLLVEQRAVEGRAAAGDRDRVAAHHAQAVGRDEALEQHSREAGLKH